MLKDSGLLQIFIFSLKSIVIFIETLLFFFSFSLVSGSLLFGISQRIVQSFSRAVHIFLHFGQVVDIIAQEYRTSAFVKKQETQGIPREALKCYVNR